MKKQALKLIGLLLAVTVICAACSHKPAYSDIDANRTPKNQNESQSAAAPSGAGEPQTVAPSQPVPAPPPTPAFKTPSFINQATGEIKDLPSYPNSARIRAQIGPVQDANVASFVFLTRDPMDKITAFYEQVIKTNRWQVIDKIIDPELSEWNLRKGDDGAKVQVKKDSQSGAMNIMLVRGEKL